MSSSALSPYEYAPLPSRASIRTLFLLPDPDLSAPIKLQLRAVSLDASPPPVYDALSYVWDEFGTGARTAVRCHGRALQVTTNCAAALRHLRYVDKPRVLWVDAICINQQDEAEKTHQVAVMGAVYSLARRVLVWVGEGSRIERFAMAFLRTFVEVEGPEVDERTRRKFADEKYRGLKEATRLLGYTTNFFGALTLCSWWKRAWTLQEVALARYALVVSGRTTIPWERLVTAVQLLHDIERDAGQWGNISALHSVMAVHRSVRAAAVKAQEKQVGDGRPRKGSQPDDRETISSILAKALTMNATVPQDRIFGLHGVFARLGVDLPPPDYGKPVAQVLAEAARLAIERDSSLDILNQVNGIESHAYSPDWPSWVPIFHKFEPPSPLNASAFHAAGTSSPSFRFSLTGPHLTVRGQRVDRIARCTALSPNLVRRKQLSVVNDMLQPVQKTKAIAAYVEWVLKFVSWGFQGGGWRKYPSAEGKRVALYSTLLQDCSLVSAHGENGSGGAIDKRRFDEGFALWQMYLMSHSEFGSLPGNKYNMKLLESEFKPEAWRPDFITWEGVDWEGRDREEVISSDEWKIERAIHSDPRSLDFYTQMQRCCSGKKFFVTNGGWMGTASAVIEEGDDIIVVAGLRVPLVMRPKNGEYELLGPAYVHGLMDGEAWRERAELEEFTFV